MCMYFKEHVVTLKREMAQDEQKKKQELEHKKDVINQAEERHRHERDDDVDDSEVVDQIFGFLPGNGGDSSSSSSSLNNSQQPTKVPKAFGDLAVAREQYILSESSSEQLPSELLEELKEYTFEKFAATYFQGQNSSVFINHKLDRPLLYHEESTDNMVSLTMLYILSVLI